MYGIQKIIDTLVSSGIQRYKRLGSDSGFPAAIRKYPPIYLGGTARNGPKTKKMHRCIPPKLGRF